MRAEVLVVGAGPAGLLTSAYINRHEVTILEDHEDVGVPKHCAGFVSKYSAEIIAGVTKWDVVDGKYDTLIFHIHRRAYEVRFKEPVIYRLDRPALEQRLLDRVYSKGHRVLFRTRAKPSEGLNRVRTGAGEVLCSKLVVAEGPSGVFRRRYFGDYRERLVGVQYIYRASGLDVNAVHTLFNECTPDFFQWIAPIDFDRVLVGFATRKYRVHPDRIVDYISRRTGAKLGSRVEVFGGVIPFDKPLARPLIRDRLFFIGDAVPTIKPYTGGGLLNTFVLAPALGRSIDIDRLDLFLSTYELIRARIIYEHAAVSLFKRVGYWIPPYVVYKLYRLGMLRPEDYDNHYELLSRALKVTPYVLLEVLAEAADKRRRSTKGSSASAELCLI